MVSPIRVALNGIESLTELALDVRWSWNHAADEIWRELDPVLWESTHSPWGVLQSVSRSRIEQLLADPSFRRNVNRLLEARRNAAGSAAWFQRQDAGALTGIAYFSMEFMLAEALPIYSGGLGNVAGDQLKAAGDLGVPVTAVGLLYSQGYFRQVIDAAGRQQAVYPYNDPGQLPVAPLRRANGEWLRFDLKLDGRSLWLRVWQVRVGRLNLYLLDSNDTANYPVERCITGELYGGGPETRLQQELILGIGGWRLLEMLDLQPEICHLNEGHAAFAVLERARSFMQANGRPFDVALAVTRAGNLFTTHTAVAAGFDRFEPELVERYLGEYAATKLGISGRELLGLGRQDPDDPRELFSPATLAMRGCGAVNGVSRLHGEVSRRLFAPLYPRWPLEAIPVGHVTNGVHMPSWDSAVSDHLWTTRCGKERWLDTGHSPGAGLAAAADRELWQMRESARSTLIVYARSRLAKDLEASGAGAEAVSAALRVLDPDVLTLGFARRFAAYKRPNLLLHDPRRLLDLLTRVQRPIQVIIAGKAHPADTDGQALIAQWTHFIRSTGARHRAVFLADYDMLLTERMVQGVDLWINTPRRPWEASGTSGMKVLVNGGLNLSELDGWWAEAYSPEVGWAIGDGREHDTDPAWDAAEAGALYDLLEREIIPQFYDRGADGIPTAWVARMRSSMIRLTPQYSSARTVRDYVEHHYRPAAARLRERAAHRGALGVRIAHWEESLRRHWHTLSLGSTRRSTANDRHHVELVVYLGELDPAAVRVELYAEPLDGGAPEIYRAERVLELPNRAGAYLFGVTAPATRPASDYTARIVPYFEGAAVPLEARMILWER